MCFRAGRPCWIDMHALERRDRPGEAAIGTGYVGDDRSGSAHARRGIVGETRRLLEQITTADQNDALVLQQRKLNVGKQINQASGARQVNRNYAAAAYGNRQSRMDVQR